jgi:hypothetical protein
MTRVVAYIGLSSTRTSGPFVRGEALDGLLLATREPAFSPRSAIWPTRFDRLTWRSLVSKEIHLRASQRGSRIHQANQ